LSSIKASSPANIVIYDTGTKNQTGKNVRVITDTVMAVQDPTTGNIKATLNFSDKFNASYRANSTSTTKPVKIATRTIEHFLNEVD
jgi:hypothetical protein